MASSQIVDNFVNTVIDTPEIAFTNETSSPITIDAFTAVNNSTVNASYKAYIKTSSGALIPIIPTRIVVWDKDDLGTGIVSHAIPSGGSIQVESSALNSIYFTVSGR